MLQICVINSLEESCINWHYFFIDVKLDSIKKIAKIIYLFNLFYIYKLNN